MMYILLPKGYAAKQLGNVAYDPHSDALSCLFVVNLLICPNHEVHSWAWRSRINIAWQSGICDQ